jgi:hypothetical protein
MKTKLSKVLGVGLALIMVFSLAMALAPTPVQAQEGEQQWNGQPLPMGPAAGGVYNVLLNGSDIGEVAVYADGMTMYAINTAVAMNAGAAATPYALYKSTDGGQTWAPVTALATAIDPTGAVPTVPLANVAIAPDNPNYVAVSIFGNQAAADVVFITRDGGATWTTLPAINAAAVAANQRIMDLKVGPAREPTIFGREYLIAVSDNAAGAVDGNLQIIGQLTTWQDIAALGVADFTSCEFSLLYAGDRIVMGVGSIAGTGTSVYAYNSQTPALLPNSPGTTLLNATAVDYIGPVGAANTDILCSDIALPNDYDANSPGFDRLWASYATAGAATWGGVWRVERGVGTWELRQVTNGTQIRSIAYTGSCAAGTLYEGDYAGLTALQSAVRFTDQAQVNLPIWYPSYKPPTGGTGRAYVRCSPTDGSTVFCVTTGVESAFNVSTDAGVTYNQESLIDNDQGDTVQQIDAITLSPDGTTLFMITNDNAGTGAAGDEMSLWKTATPPSPFSWVRIFCLTKTAAGGADIGTMALNMGGWADAPEIYFADRSLVAGGLYASYDGGNVFLRKNFQVALGATGFLSVGGSKQLYHSVAASPLIYRSTTGGNSWLTPAIDANAGNVTSVIPAPNGDILVGGSAGLASISKDAGATFSPLQPGLNPLGNYVVTADEGYADNNILYAFDFTATASGVYRINVATDGSWIALANPAGAALVGAGQNSGTLYAMTAAAGCDRTLYPHWDVGAMAATWGNMGAGALPAGVAPGTFAVAANKAYAARSGAVVVGNNLWGYNDYFATHSATINSPADGSTIGIDPVTGRADILELAWSTLGTGTGQANAYNVYIWEKAVGPGGASVFAALAFAGGGVSSPSILISPGAGAVAPNINYTFIGGRDYGIMLEAQNSVSADAVNSAMSAPIFFSVEPSTGIISPTSAGPVLQSPQPGDQDVNPGCSFSWAPMAGVTEYSFILAKDAALTDVVVSDTVSGTAYGPVTLEFDTDYYYAVQATAPTSSVQSIGAFHTSVEKYTCQYCGLTFDSREALEAHIAAVHAPTTPLYIWIVIAIGAILVIVVIWLIFNTRRA